MLLVYIKDFKTVLGLIPAGALGRGGCVLLQVLPQPKHRQTRRHFLA